MSQAEKEASAAVSTRVAEGVELLEKGRELQAQGDFNKALAYFTLVGYITYSFYCLFLLPFFVFCLVSHLVKHYLIAYVCQMILVSVKSRLLFNFMSL